MLSTETSRPRRKRARLALAAALIAVGCSGSTGGGCGTGCTAFKTKDANGLPIVYHGSRLDNVAQVRLTKSGFNFLNATHLNSILSDLNNGTAGGFTFPCTGPIAPSALDLCSIGVTRFTFMIADEDFNNVCGSSEGAKLYMDFKDVSWVLDSANNILRAHLIAHIHTGDIYVHTVEDHSTICSGYPALLRVWLNDEAGGLPQKDTAIDLALQFSTTPDGRLEFNIPDSSLNTILTNFQPGAFGFDGRSGSDPAAPTTNTGSYTGDGCDSASGTYTPSDGTDLNGGCASLANDINANCDFSQSNPQGGICAVLQYVRDYLLNYVKTTFQSQILKIIREQLDNARCQRAVDSHNSPIACDGPTPTSTSATHPCLNDDDGNQLFCDTSRGVCYPPAQGDANYNCEPIPLAVQGVLDVSDLTQVVGFPPGTKLDVFAALGSKGSNGGAKVDDNGVQLAAEAGTAPPSSCNVDADCVAGATCISNICSYACTTNADCPTGTSCGAGRCSAPDTRSACVPLALPPANIAVPPMDFDANKPTNPPVTAYDMGFSLASAMLNRGFYDAYNAGLLCLSITNKTSSFISSGLFKTFLPSLGLVTGGGEVPMMILMRPTSPPYVRVGLNTTKTDTSGNVVPDDPLVTLSFKQLNLDFYALVDERQVRVFTLQADLKLPLNLRTFPAPQSDTLQPVLGGLDTLLTNISALSPDGGAYSATTDMLSEDPGVVKDLLAAAVQLAQPLLAGVIKPVQLPLLLSHCTNPADRTTCTDGLKVNIDGVAGAVAYTDIVNQGYNHLGIWAHVNECGTSVNVGCEQYNVKTQVRVANRTLPDSAQEVRNGIRPALDLELSALQARTGVRAEFSYRVDGGLWSPWLSNPKLRVQNPLFLIQGHHTVEVTSRQAGDDHTMDLEPVAVDFFVSYEAPKVSLSQRPDGAIVTSAHSPASRDSALSFSYRLDGESSWTRPGPARVFSQEELGGNGLSVSVSDEAGRAAQAHFGEEEGARLTQASMTAGCATSSAPALSALVLLGMALLLRRHRSGAPKGSSSAG